jgi:leucyl aminopeptidase
MKADAVSKSLADVKADALVILHDEKGMFAAPDAPGIRAHCDAFARHVADKTSSREWFCTLAKDSGAKTSHLLLDSCTFGDWLPGNEKLKATAARAAATCRAHSLTHLAIAVAGEGAAAKAAAILEGIHIGDFSDQRFKGEAKPRKPLELTFVVDESEAKATREAIRAAMPVLEGVQLARELVNAPNNELTPAALVGAAASVAAKNGLKAEILDEKKLQKMGYTLLYNVGRGSEFQPRMAVIKYTPARTRIKEHIVLIGKGMTFDTGGLCIKPGDNMPDMNNDMGGAAAVIGAMHAISTLKLPVRVTAIIPSAHNAVDGAAYHPGAIIRSKSGKTVFIGNTDAEGRLILADAMARAGEEGADIIIDVATLTGACAIALGPRLAGLFTDDAQLRDVLLASGEATGDNVWPLPLWREYEAFLKHHLADLNNIASGSARRNGGATHGANFIKAFVPENARWAHLDIAATAVTEGPARCFGKGATGFGVRLLTDAVRRLVEA